MIDEAVIRREVGGTVVMREQLERLLELGRLPKVSLQVLPFSAGAHAALGSSFVALRLADPPDAQMVYLENLWSADFVDRPVHVRSYTIAFDTDQSTHMITQAIEELIKVSGPPTAEAVGPIAYAGYMPSGNQW